MPKLPNSQPSRAHSQRGFSLIEILVSTTLLVLMLMTATTMFMTFLVSNAKTNVRHTIKGEGAAALSRMEFLIRNAESVTANCAPGGTSNVSITIKNFGDSKTYTLSIVSDKIRYAATDGTSTELLNSTTTNAIAPAFFNCYGNTNSNRRIEISFALEATADTLNSGTSISESFRSTVQIRN
jgi:prepilin-type N-terminal cleavage/methylation domain-containing protein